MGKRILNIVILTALTLLTSCASLLMPKNPPSPINKHVTADESVINDFKKLRWSEKNLPIIISAPKSMIWKLKPILERAVNVWNESARKKIIDYTFDDYDPDFSKVQNFSDERTRIYFSNRWDMISEDNGMLALTWMDFYGNSVHEADIFFNLNYDFYYTSALLTIQNDQYDFESCLIHEIGHVLGLDHASTDFPESIMSTTLRNGAIKRETSLVDNVEIFVRYFP